MILAHETWFLEDAGGYDWSFLTEGTTLALLGAALLVTLAVRLINSWRDGVDVGFLAAMAPYMPFAIRMHLAVSLIGPAIGGGGTGLLTSGPLGLLSGTGYLVPGIMADVTVVAGLLLSL